MAKKFHVSLVTATLLIVANSIGTGIFTTTGFASADLKNPYLVLGVWIFGAVYSLIGVSCYEELHRFFPGSGGEYHFLHRGLHPRLGVMAGWVTLIAGFSAPIATSAMAFAIYSNRFFGGNLPPLLTASALVLAVFAFHATLLSSGLKIHDSFVWIKLVGISLLVIVPAFFVPWQWPAEGLPHSFPVAPLAKSFFWIAFAYTGWNAVYYVAAEVSGDSGNARKASLWGTVGVCVIYILINVLLLFGTNTAALEGKAEVFDMGKTKSLEE